MDTTPTILDAIGQFVVAGLAIFGAVAGVYVGILIFKWGLHKLEDAALDRMHSEWGTSTFRKLGARGQAIWSSADRNWSRRRIMSME